MTCVLLWLKMKPMMSTILDIWSVDRKWLLVGLVSLEQQQLISWSGSYLDQVEPSHLTHPFTAPPPTPCVAHKPCIMPHSLQDVSCLSHWHQSIFLCFNFLFNQSLKKYGFHVYLTWKTMGLEDPFRWSRNTHPWTQQPFRPLCPNHCPGHCRFSDKPERNNCPCSSEFAVSNGGQKHINKETNR